MKTLRTVIAALLLGTACLSAYADNAAAQGIEASVPAVSENVRVKVRAGNVDIENVSDESIDYAVYAITGVLVEQGSISPSETVSIELPSGYFIVKAGKHSRRVAVK